MKIHVWNAFASNNSGSYVIVGSFPSEALAAEVASDLLAMANAQSSWLQPEQGGPTAAPPSPLETFARTHGLPWNGEGAMGDDWPWYSGQDHPAVWAIGHQVFVHSDYTATMPPLLGHFMYARGGRVETEIDHAHHPIVAVFELWFPWQDRKNNNDQARVQAIVDALCAEDGPLTTQAIPGSNPAWRANEQFPSAGLVVGAVFADLCAGFTGVAEIARRHGAEVRVRLFEAWSEEEDPLVFLRPCAPPVLQPPSRKD